ncbi:Guanine nucleotide-binding protein subunit alpha [Tritrichomonas foetus]|uniref:Guanine nucleotide-binding protein subunit alpha n=1 Tax=Tritrichomonas foetus TaxID=1144522 RepID=A0A1J4K5W8_9EUKA|nr:Guanine nucleotide-binding protein subunit alpha [Tritrichomonas foetus]|eukprot:OHT06386.1 Guanine nucleotide-binding protein subunit alpha [Tritrichomonas foetus]
MVHFSEIIHNYLLKKLGILVLRSIFQKHLSGVYFHLIHIMVCCNETDDPALQTKGKSKNQRAPPVKKDQSVTITMADSNDEEDKVKIGVIGPFLSGKSTLLRQAGILYGSRFFDEDRSALKPCIRTLILRDMKTLIEEVEQSGKPIDPVLSTSISLLKEITPNEDELVSDVVSSIIDIWNDETVKSIYEEKKIKNYLEHSSYFFDRVEKIAEQDYVPTDEDMLMYPGSTHSNCRDHDFNFNTKLVQITEVQGNTSGRRMWDRVLRGANYIMFVVSLSDFDYHLFEDDTIEVSQLSMTLFSQICEADQYRDIPVFLVLNKSDLFEKKIKEKTDLFNNAYPGFEGDVNNVNDAIEHVKQAYLSKVDARSNTGFVEAISVNSLNKESVANLMQKIAQKVVA